MTTSGAEPPSGSAGEPVEFVVAQEHASLVLGALEARGVTSVEEDARDALGLTLVTGVFDRNAEWGGELRTDAGDRPEPQEPDSLLLDRLRKHFEGAYSGWSPIMGRNRFLGLDDEEVSGGGGTVSHGGGPDPRPAQRPEIRMADDLGPGLAVGVIDTAIYPHPDLAGGYVGKRGRDVLDPAEDTQVRPYAAGHATFVAGLILDRAPTAAVRVRKALDPGGTARSWDVANEIIELGRTGIQILNLSLVCYTWDAKPPLALATAIDRLDPEILVVACAGNHGDPHLSLPSENDRRKPSWPAALDDVVAVGSATRTTGKDGVATYKLSPFTPPDAPWIDVVTCGEEVTSTYFHGKGVRGTPPQVNPATEESFSGWAVWSGTSFAAALLTGEIASVAAGSSISPRAAFSELLRTRAASDDGQPPFIDL